MDKRIGKKRWKIRDVKDRKRTEGGGGGGRRERAGKDGWEREGC